MSDEYRDTSGNTEAFRVFAQKPDPAANQAPSRLPLLIGAAVAAVVVVALIAWVALG
ncbi:hypothetical protein O7627_28080 [Solwaraspora sp. WMMD1047]|jgi:hypothetical protein|uniref:hypothetical protein n=1 Tax=Solwaraspora sp. WMMD1047 TaxID=3016102 RepID=UPI002416045C|nr:hypothetical protein [Solwaraspora sp. WMMD1047]MDG4833137.1 hypothetical protein [Solwaraspora sp. WMMD1047]